jgi:hypothetical protein
MFRDDSGLGKYVLSTYISTYMHLWVCIHKILYPISVVLEI